METIKNNKRQIKLDLERRTTMMDLLGQYLKMMLYEVSISSYGFTNSVETTLTLKAMDKTCNENVSYEMHLRPNRFDVDVYPECDTEESSFRLIKLLKAISVADKKGNPDDYLHFNFQIAAN